MVAVTDHKRPLDSAIDLVVYAPLGFALEARQLLPSLVERGRNQVTMAKMVGQFAVKQGQVEAEKRLAGVQRRADGVLSEFGFGKESSAEPSQDTPPAAQATGEATTKAKPVTAEPVHQNVPAADDLAIPGYDSLAASQVIPRLEGLNTEEISAIARYESAHRGRKTILGKISQLRGT